MHTCTCGACRHACCADMTSCHDQVGAALDVRMRTLTFITHFQTGLKLAVCCRYSGFRQSCKIEIANRGQRMRTN